MRERGFSLIELIVAMVITMLIMGSVYGLIAGGQNAFRREPELAERQQNIRMAMDLIMKDIANAASGLPTFVQAFTPGLDACAACPWARTATVTDEIEILTNSESRDTEPVCRTIGIPGGQRRQRPADARRDRSGDEPAAAAHHRRPVHGQRPVDAAEPGQRDAQRRRRCSTAPPAPTPWST